MKRYFVFGVITALVAFGLPAFSQETEVQPANDFYGASYGYKTQSYGDCYGHKTKKIELSKLDFRAYKYTMPLAFLSGACDGFNQSLHFRYASFKKRFPGARDQFWRPDISWQNKYAKTPDNQILTDYEAFPFSTTLLVFATDGHHLTRAGDHLFMLGAVTLNIGEKKVWYQYVIDFTAGFIARSAGFNLMYGVVFKP